MRIHYLLLFTSAVTLSSCSVFEYPFLGQQQPPAVALHINQQNAWWASFQDPLMDNLARQLVTQNLDIKMAEARIEEARALTNTSTAAFFPNISATSIGERGNNQIGFPKTGNILQGGFDASWEIDIFGSTRNEVRAAQARMQAAMVTADDVRNSALYDLMRAIVEWHAAQQTLHETMALVTSQDEQISLFRSRAEGGLNDATFLERAIAQRDQTATGIPVAQAAIQTAEFQIERLLGKKSDDLFQALSSHSADKDLSVPSAQATLAISIQTIKSRPDVRAAEARMIAAQADLGKAKADLWPKLDLGGFFGADSSSSSVPIAANPIWSLTYSATMPLLNFGRLQGAVDAADARAKEAALDYQNIVLLALQETRTALSDYLNGINAINQQALALKHRQNTIQLAKDRFEHGLTDKTDLTTAQTELDQATLALITQKQNTAIAYIRLQKALGNIAWSE